MKPQFFLVTLWCVFGPQALGAVTSLEIAAALDGLAQSTQEQIKHHHEQISP